MLVHICCSVDSHFFLEKLKKEFPKEKLIGYFYDPNIHPYSEYVLRLMDVKRSCDRLGIELIEGEYDLEEWLKRVKGLEKEPEKGQRCRVCFDYRLQKSAQMAKKLGIKRYTTTLLVSPQKSQEQLKATAKEIDRREGLEFVFVDYRKGGGTQLQSLTAKREKLYRQDYCGCMFGLSMQREEQNIFLDEMISPVNRSVLPASIEERIAVYSKRMELEKDAIDYKIVKRRFLNYRNLRSFIRYKKSPVPSHFVFYSTTRREYLKTKALPVDRYHSLSSREETIFLTLRRYNQLTGYRFESVKELSFFPIEIEKELKLREKLELGPYDTTAIIVTDELLNGEVEIYLLYRLYNDVRENLVTLR